MDIKNKDIFEFLCASALLGSKIVGEVLGNVIRKLNPLNIMMIL